MRSNAIESAAEIVRQGGIIAYATEYCFGLGCDPKNRAAVQRLLRVKRRPVHKGLIVLAGDIHQLSPYAQALPDAVLATWPGPHTWLVPPRANVPGWVTGRHDRIALRVTAHPQAAALCRIAGMAIISTSANRAGTSPTRSYRDAVRRFHGEVDYILPGRVGGAPAPTPIRDALSGRLIRAG